MITVRVKRSIFQWSNQSFWPGFSKACSKYEALRLIKHTTETTPTLCLDLEASCAVIARLIHLVMHAGKHSVCVCMCVCVCVCVSMLYPWTCDECSGIKLSRGTLKQRVYFWSRTVCYSGDSPEVPLPYFPECSTHNSKV